MRFRAATEGIQEGDMTPMIDMVFQLIAFFMVLINFTEADRNELIHLPSSELAKPPDAPPPSPITLQVTRTGKVILGPNAVPIAGLKSLLLLERQIIEAKGAIPYREATIIIRADAGTKFGEVQKVITLCQETGFEKFALRAKQQERQRENT